jgi:heat shock protein HslJ
MSQLSRAGRSLVAVAVTALLLPLTACVPSFSSAVDPVGVWSESSGDDSPTLSLLEDTTVNGYDGCNQLTGGWEPTDDGVNFKNLASTRMACEGVDDWLSRAASAEIAYDTMTVLDENGDELGTLKRTDETPEGS